MNDKYKPFSERHGYTQPKPVQRESVDQDLLNALWNVLIGTIYTSHSEVEWLLSSGENRHLLWCGFMKKREDDFVFNIYHDNAPRFGDARKDKFAKIIRDEHFEFSADNWFRVFDFLEFLINKGNFTRLQRGHGFSHLFKCDQRRFIGELNYALEQENSAYRIVGKLFTEITSEQEITEIETALQIPFDSAKSHLEKALALFSDRENPDYENSIKESIHAVESIAKKMTGKENSLNALTQELKLHPNLTNGLNELYNWTSKDGIRHGKSGKPLSVDQDTDRFMLVTCSAFVNYIIARHQTT